MSEKINEKYMQYSSSQVDYNVKTIEVKDDYERFKNRLKIFDEINDITKAKELAKGFLPIENEKNYLKIGNARCVIISRGDVFRICLDSEDEYICYNIIK